MTDTSIIAQAILLITLAPILLMLLVGAGWWACRPPVKRHFKPFSLHPTKGIRGS